MKENNQGETCPHCNHKHAPAEATLLKAGFNGIKHGDVDDKDCFECVRCDKEFGARKK